MSALFGPAGNSLSFYEAGYKHSYQEPAYLEALGLDAYEYSAGNGVRGGDAVFTTLGQEAKKRGIRLSLHAPYYISLSGTNPEKRLKSLSYIEQSLHAAELMGADTIVIHAGSVSGNSRAQALLLAKDTLYRALCAFPDTPLHLGIETMGKLNQLGTLEEVLQLCTLDPRLYPVIDFGHLNARSGGGLFQTKEDYLKVFDQVERALGAQKAERLHCHFSKIEYTAAGEKRHLTFADRLYGPCFEPLIDGIVAQGLSPRIICESAGTMAEDALSMKRYYLEKRGGV